MAKAAQAISAKNFHDPLLMVLATHTKFDSGRKVKADYLYDPICKMMGFDQMSFGETGGVPWTQKWIQWAFQAIRDEGLGVKHARGTWGLTPDGVDKVRSMMNVQISTNVLSSDEVEDLVRSVAEDQPKTNLQNDGTYHSDPYICTVGLDNHKCFGFFTTQSPICVSCPARNPCQIKLWDKLAFMASELNEADIFAAKVATKATQAPANPDSTKPPHNDEPIRYHPPADAVILESTCSGTVVCDHCGGIINDGEASVWIRKVGPLKNKSMMLHRGCLINECWPKNSQSPSSCGGH